MPDLHEIIRMPYLVAYPVVFTLRSWSAGRDAQTYEKGSHFSVYSRLSLSLPVFELVNEWIILKLYEMMRVQLIFVWPVVFILLVTLVGREKCSNS